MHVCYNRRYLLVGGSTSLYSIQSHFCIVQYKYVGSKLLAVLSAPSQTAGGGGGELALCEREALEGAILQNMLRCFGLLKIPPNQVGPLVEEGQSPKSNRKHWLVHYFNSNLNTFRGRCATFWQIMWIGVMMMPLAIGSIVSRWEGYTFFDCAFTKTICDDATCNWFDCLAVGRLRRGRMVEL